MSGSPLSLFPDLTQTERRRLQRWLSNPRQAQRLLSVVRKIIESAAHEARFEERKKVQEHTDKTAIQRLLARLRATF